jgi:general secretion pathway protein E
VDHSTELGLQYHAGATPDLGGPGRSLVYGGLDPLGSILPPDATALQGLALGVRGPELTGSDELLGIGFSVPAFGVVINALAHTGDANVLATPHILATDNVAAEINVGENIPLQENIGGGFSNLASLAGAAGGQGTSNLGALAYGGYGFNTPRQDVGTKIKVTPHINESNQVRLEIEEEISERGASSGALGAVSITQRNASTTLVVDDQQTVVIGGLMRDAVVKSKEKIPILGDIPVLGFLFRSSRTENRKTNLLLILTPYVIHDQSDLRRIFERKMQERQEFLDRYFVFARDAWEPPRDYTRANGLVEDIRQAYAAIEERERLEAESARHGSGWSTRRASRSSCPSRRCRRGATRPARGAPAATPPAAARLPRRAGGAGGTHPAPVEASFGGDAAGPARGAVRGAEDGAQRRRRAGGVGAVQPQRALGNILARHGLIPLEALENLYEQQIEKRVSLADLVVQGRLASEADIGRSLAAECGLPFVERIDVESVPVEIGARLPIGFCRSRRLVVVGEDESRVLVVCADPLATDGLDDVRAAFGKPVQASVGAPSMVIDAINRIYERQQTASDLRSDDALGEEETEDILDSDEDAPIIRWVNSLFAQAVKERASDIHIEPEEKEVLVRYRVDGELYVARRASRQFMASVVARVKIMAGLNIAETRLPQDGRISLRIAGRAIDVRVSTIPTSRDHERIVMRLLHKSNVLLDLTELGFSPRDFHLMSRLITRAERDRAGDGPYGQRQDDDALRVPEQDQPAEHQHPDRRGPGGVRARRHPPGSRAAQDRADLASALRAFLRQDPDVIMVGETRDRETADIAMRASMTGHLVLSTLHTNDAASAFTRLVDMEIEPFLVRTTVIRVLAQRLVRVLCRHCKEPYEASRAELAELGCDPERTEWRASRVLGHAYRVPEVDYIPVGWSGGPLPIFHRARGCERCEGKGFTGRIGIYELLMADDVVGQLVLKNADGQSIKRAAQQQGMDTLRDDGARKVFEGITTVEEVVAETHEDEMGA